MNFSNKISKNNFSENLKMADFIPELIWIGVDLLICGGLSKAINSTNNLIRDLSTSPQIPIDDQLQSKIQNHPSCISGCDPNTQTIPYAIIRGEVAPIEKALDSNYATDMVIKGYVVKVDFNTIGFRWVSSRR